MALCLNRAQTSATTANSSNAVGASCEHLFEAIKHETVAELVDTSTFTYRNAVSPISIDFFRPDGCKQLQYCFARKMAQDDWTMILFLLLVHLLEKCARWLCMKTTMNIYRLQSIEK